MNDNEAQQILEEILAQAEAGQATEFRLINSWAEFREVNRTYKANKIIVNMLKQSSKSLFNTYCKDVIAGISDVTKLIAYSQLVDVIDFYQNEVKTLDDMLNEYDDYLWHGNIFYALMGGERFTWR
jgi:hypothetical protein